eukprot:Gb_14996 [translate_table: standard]
MEDVLNMENCFITSMEDAGEALLHTAVDQKMQNKEKQKNIMKNGDLESSDDPWLCAICLDRIQIHDFSRIKGCEHAYCVTCILRWASYKADPWCPQCKQPFSFLFVHRTLDGSLHDYMFEESVCLLLRASWFKPVPIQFQEAVEEQDDYQYEDEMDEEYYSRSNVHLGNRRWGDSGYVRAGHKEARPVGARQVHATRSQNETGVSSSRANKGKEVSKEGGGRRAMRAQKRDAAEKAAAVKQQKHLQKLGCKALL